MNRQLTNRFLNIAVRTVWPYNRRQRINRLKMAAGFAGLAAVGIAALPALTTRVVPTDNTEILSAALKDVAAPRDYVVLRPSLK